MQMDSPVETTVLQPEERIVNTQGILTIANINTTIGYCRYDEGGSIEYIFVHPAYRRSGYARRMLALVREQVRQPLSLQPPISPLGARLQRYCKGG
jgi:GNAT superfamily N-acetyltransferase